MNVTNDPNQQNRPNVFGEDFNYPAPNSEWNRFTTNYCSPPNFPFCSNYGSEPVTFPMQTEKTHFGPNVYAPNIYPARPQYNFGNTSIHTPFRCKRKTDSPPPVNSKQHITEEKMAEHLSKLHISSETANSNEPEENRAKRLYMCEEMRKLQNDTILPASLLNKIQRPCTALVLWQPPQSLIPEEKENNNEEEVIDNNLMDLDSR